MGMGWEKPTLDGVVEEDLSGWDELRLEGEHLPNGEGTF